MKKLLLTSLLTGLTIFANAQDITFAMEPTYPPFENTNDKGEIIGFDVDIANAICKELQATCKFTGQAFDALIPSLKSKRFDAAISAIDITDARKKQVSFSDPYYDSSASFLALADKADLNKAKTVGVQNGTTFQQYIVNEATQYDAKPYASLQTALLDLKNGRIDMIFGDTAVLAEWMKNDKGLVYLGDKVTNSFGIAVNKANTALLNDINKGLMAIKANGEYQKIHDKWFPAQ